MCALSLSLGLRLGLLTRLSRLLMLLLLLLLGLLICCCLSLLIGLGGCVGSVSGVGCTGLLHSCSQELRLSLLQQHLLLCWQQSRQLAERERRRDETRREKERDGWKWTERDKEGNKVFKKQHCRRKQGKAKAQSACPWACDARVAALPLLVGSWSA